MNTKKSSILKFYLNIFLLFFYIYEFNLGVWGFSTFITSRRIVVLIILLVALLNSLVNNKPLFKIPPLGEVTKSYRKIFFLNIFVIFYVLVIFSIIGMGTGKSIVNDVIELILFSLVPILFYYQFFEDVNDIMKVLMMVSVIQAVIILICMINPQFSNFIDKNFYLDYEYVTRHRIGYAGGLAAITAPGLLRFSMGYFAVLYFYFKTQKIRYIILFISLSVIGTLIARTGLVLSVVGLVVTFIFLLFNKRNINILKYTLLLSLMVIFTVVIIEIFSLQQLFETSFSRVFDWIELGINEVFFRGYFGDAAGNVFPEISLKTFFGTGITSGTSGNGIYANMDGGYLRLMFALGIPLMSSFYLILFGSLISMIWEIRNSALKFSMLYFLAILVIGEFKEYTIYTQYMIMIFFVIMFISKKEMPVRKSKMVTI